MAIPRDRTLFGWGTHRPTVCPRSPQRRMSWSRGAGGPARAVQRKDRWPPPELLRLRRSLRRGRRRGFATRENDGRRPMAIPRRPRVIALGEVGYKQESVHQTNEGSWV